MVEQANNFRGSIVEFYKSAAQTYGTWLAVSNTRLRIAENLDVDHGKVFRRATIVPANYASFAKAHAWGQKFAKAYGTNSDELPGILRHSSLLIPMSVRKSLTAKALEKRVKVSSRSDETEPVWFRCRSCETIHNYHESTLTLDNALVCQNCVDSGYVRTSECMDGLILSDNAAMVYHTERAAEYDDSDYATPEWCRENGYRRRNGYWYSEEALAYIATPSGIYGYHSGPDLPKIASPEYDKRTPRVLLGMELEVENICDESDEDVSNEDIAKSIYKSVGSAVKNYMKCERDGSLDNGFEIITAPTGLDIHAKALAQLRNADHFDQIHSHSTDTCGLHVHVCKAGMTVLHAAKLQQFINSSCNEKLVRTIARRYQTNGNGYAKITHDNWVKRMGQLVGPSYRARRNDKKQGWGNGRIDHSQYTSAEFVYDRYSALNFRNDHTVEFRLFRGTLKFESIMACLEFSYACWFFTREASIGGLTTENFMKFICRAENRKDTKHLRAYLKAKKFRAFFQAEQIARPKFKETQPTERDERIMLDEEPMHVPLRATGPSQFVLAA